MIRNLFGIIPAALWVIVLVSLFLYKLDKLAPQIRGEIEAHREAADKEQTGETVPEQ